MIRNLLFVCLLFISVSSIYSQAYFPLEIGNRWDYQRTEWDPVNYYTRTDTFSVVVVKDTLMSNGKTYFVLNTSYLGVGKFVRTDSLGIYYYLPEESKEWLVYRNNAVINKGYLADSAGTSSPFVTLEIKDTTTYFGSIVNIAHYSYNWMIGHRITFADKYGPVSHHSSGGDYSFANFDSKLIGCRISCVEFGKLTSAEKAKTNTEGFFLSENYPNPFNPATTIKYSVPRAMHVKLSVFDLLGKEVIILVDDYKAAGIHKVQFNAGGLPSGIYIYTIHAGQYQASRKLLLIK